MSPPATSSREALDRERLRVLRQFENWLELPMLLLGCGWLLLAWMRFTRGLNPMLEALAAIIWAVFFLEFGLRLALAPRKKLFLTKNRLASVALFIPAARLFRAQRIPRLLRHYRSRWFFQLLGGDFLRALGVLMRRLVSMAVVGVLLTAAGGLALHVWASPVEEATPSFLDALWRAVMMILLNSDWPENLPGRFITLLLRCSGFVMLACIIASFVSYWRARDSRTTDANVELRAMLHELALLRAEFHGVMAAQQKAGDPLAPAGRSETGPPAKANVTDV